MIRAHLSKLIRSLRVAYFEIQVRRFEAAAAQARMHARTTFLELRSTRDERLDAMSAWRMAGQLSDRAESYRDKIKGAIYESV